jgi:hypothetical protein
MEDGTTEVMNGEEEMIHALQGRLRILEDAAALRLTTGMGSPAAQVDPGVQPTHGRCHLRRARVHGGPNHGQAGLPLTSGLHHGQQPIGRHPRGSSRGKDKNGHRHRKLESEATSQTHPHGRVGNTIAHGDVPSFDGRRLRMSLWRDEQIKFSSYLIGR